MMLMIGRNKNTFLELYCQYALALLRNNYYRSEISIMSIYLMFNYDKVVHTHTEHVIFLFLPPTCLFLFLLVINNIYIKTGRVN